MGTTRIAYARAIIQALEADRTTAREMSLVAVMTGENSRAAWNPMDTTWEAPGVTPYNSFGPNGEYHVWNYPNAIEGIEATIATMRQRNMAPWLDVLLEPRVPAIEICRAFGEVPWAGIGDRVPMDLVSAWDNHSRRYQSDAQAWVEGYGIWPYKRNGKPA